jgi:hypothetical protein
MKLTIVSLKSKTEHHAVWIEINTPDGNFVLQPHYSPTTFILVAHKDFTYCLTTGKLETITLEKEALLSVTRTSALLLLN